MEMGEKFVENDFLKDFGQKWKVRNGTVVFQKIFVKRWLFQQRFDDGCLQIVACTMPVVRDVLMMFVMVGKRVSRFS